MLDFLPFSIGILATTVACMLLGSHVIRLCSAVLFLNWATHSSFTFATGLYDPWYFLAVLDGLSAALLLTHPASKLQVILGATYASQILMHLAYGGLKLFGRFPDYDMYYDMLTIVAWAQLFVLGGGVSGDIGRRIYHSWSVWRLSAASPHHSDIGKFR